MDELDLMPDTASDLPLLPPPTNAPPQKKQKPQKKIQPLPLFLPTRYFSTKQEVHAENFQGVPHFLFYLKGPQERSWNEVSCYFPSHTPCSFLLGGLFTFTFKETVGAILTLG